MDYVGLALAGVAAGLFGSTAGFASSVSYPALLAFGLTPIQAGVTNMAALLGITVGSIASSAPELSGRHSLAAHTYLPMAVGGAIGAVLILLSDQDTFAAIVPGFILLFAVMQLFGERPLHAAVPTVRRLTKHPEAGWYAFLLVAGIYGGYIGAGLGSLLIVTFAVRFTESFHVVNALKNVASGISNVTAVLVLLFSSQIHLSAAVALGAGSAIGGWFGPVLMRPVREEVLRVWFAGFSLLVALLLIADRVIR